jgi:osmotically-inducible protein OsmY
MIKLKRIAMFSLAAFAAVSAAEAKDRKDTSPPPTLERAVRDKLERLSYYGVFDILQYQVKDGGVVELSGFAFRDSLKDEAEDAVLKVSGVKQVVNKIEDLDWGVQDDEIRAKVFLTIYRDSFLSRYGTSTDMALANGVGYSPRGRFGSFGAFGPLGALDPFFPGFNPSGDYGIHIVVSNGEVILMGEVDNEGDKILAALKARGVFPVKKVFNELTVRGAKPEPGQAPPPLQKGKRGFVAVAETF